MGGKRITLKGVGMWLLMLAGGNFVLSQIDKRLLGSKLSENGAAPAAN